MGQEPKSHPPADALPARRRLAGPGEGEKVGRGCLIWGGVLGVVVGLTFAFYGLPPILRHFYGERQVMQGEWFSTRTLSIQVATVEHIDTYSGAERIVVVTLAQSSSGVPPNERWQLEMSKRDEWVRAAPDATELRFVIRSEDGTPIALHLSKPRVRFELPPSNPP